MKNIIIMVGNEKFTVLYPDLLRPLTDSERSRLKASINLHGVKVPLLVDGKSGIIDGVNRAMIAAELSQTYVPTVIIGGISDAQKRAIALSCNVDRRNLTTEEQTTAREQRIARVTASRATGESLRSIAETENVSHTQIAADLSMAEGKKKHAPGKKPKLLCDRCQRITPIPGCHKCAALRAARKAEKKKASQAKESPTVDPYGMTIPPERMDAFHDPWITETLESLVEMQREFRASRFGDGLKKRAQFYPFIDAQTFIDALGFIDNYLQKLIDHLRTNRPATVCHTCEGKGCAVCRMKGLLPQAEYDKVK